MSKPLRRIVAWRPCEELRAAQSHAVAIRKLLSSAQQRGLNGRGAIDDALQLALTIEHLAHRGQNCDADEAVEIASHVEILISMLKGEVDNLFTS